MRYARDSKVGWKHYAPILMCVAGLAMSCSHVLADDNAGNRVSAQLHPPVRLEADGKPIDIALLSPIAHAGPCIADVDGDGDRDLLVGDFPGYFWYFQNDGDDAKPAYTEKGKLRAGGVDAKTPVY